MTFPHFDDFVASYLSTANDNGLKQLLVGGAAVNFYGYKRHSADVDFWIDMNNENYLRLERTLNDLGFDTSDMPQDVKDQKKNITIKSSPDLSLELITNFFPNKTFVDAYKTSVRGVYKTTKSEIAYRIISYEDLLVSKIKAGRPKDLLDIYELKRLRGE